MLSPTTKNVIISYVLSDVPSFDPFNDTVWVCQKLVSTLGLTLSGHFDRKVTSSNERLTGLALNMPHEPSR